MALPRVPLTLPAANPLTGGLYSAATVTDLPDARIDGGLDVDSPNHQPHGRWGTGCPDATDPTGTRPARRQFDATVAWASDQCAPVGVTAQEASERAQHGLRLTEQIDVEEHTAAALNAGATATDAPSLITAVEQIEEALGAHGYAGVIHARRGMIALAQKAGVLVRQGQGLFSPGGHRWAFGPGYGALGNTLVATGPVLVQRGPVSEEQVFEPKNNDRLTVASRTVAVAWDTPHLAVTVPTAGTGETILVPSDGLFPSDALYPNG